MCKVHDAIIELSKKMESQILICRVDRLKIEGELVKCDDKGCFDEVITLKNAKVSCCKEEKTFNYKWLNIPSKHIKTFAFKCCEM